MSQFDLSELEKDAFGGDTTNLTSDELYISNTSGGSYGKNAYMLIYEKKLKNPIREVVIAPADAGAAANEEEKIRQVDYSQVDKYIPEWISSKIQKDNTKFLIDSQVFNDQFFQLIKLILKHISKELTMKTHNFDYQYQQYFHRMFQISVKVGHKVMFDYLSHYQDSSRL